MSVVDENDVLEPRDPTCEVCGRQVPRVEYDTKSRLLVCPHCRSRVKPGLDRPSNNTRARRRHTSAWSS
jgi:ribosome-binding protein aMBF1 (putative translation factor)